MEPDGAAVLGGVRHGGRQAGLRSATHAVLAAANKSNKELFSHARVFRIADHARVALVGLTADGRVLLRFLRNDYINHAFVYETPLPISRFPLHLADKAKVRPLRPIPFCYYFCRLSLWRNQI
jgi:20S proteasome subunit alpha 6